MSDGVGPSGPGAESRPLEPATQRDASASGDAPESEMSSLPPSPADVSDAAGLPQTSGRAGSTRRRLPIAIVVAAIVVAGALVAAAIIIGGGDGDAPRTADAPATSASATPTAVAADANTPTCQAWKVTRSVLAETPQLPPGWDWNTPNIERYVSDRSAAMNTALDLFEPKIADDKSAASQAARRYISAQRSAMKKLGEHTYVQADLTSVVLAHGELDQLCGVS